MLVISLLHKICCTNAAEMAGGLTSALTLASVDLAIGVLVFGWALELVVGALVETVK